ncbi:YidC family membrane integrase SpoIIIJ [Bacillus benzoevorans]|uniref:Membrane protein insertase YidC n=1 Tax=Bacillus benzoevorans TaxID=1456 RepID=A0A7X0HR70_9BACI|nr:YidC family membrane integrase SpoIIIJ [Bacillus benzoevorans]MBB6445413.1 YidC/Oxa1 family membrane protein insertase [Bacillus benzoevorans]
MRKKIFLLIGFILLITLLSGCAQVNEPITPESEGIWNKYIVYPLSWFIVKVADFAGGSFGLSIIIVTIIIRLIILPLMIKQIKSSKAMQAIQPEMKKLKEKYSSKDQKTQQQLQEETMKLFQQYNINPLAGCFPILIQMPILIGFYHAIMREPKLQEHAQFLWFDLSAPDPIFLLPILAGVTTFIQQKISMVGMEDNQQMKMMLWMMPIMIVVFAFNLPTALSLYWVVGNIFSIVQTYFIKGPELKAAAAGKSGGAKK